MCFQVQRHALHVPTMIPSVLYSHRLIHLKTLSSSLVQTSSLFNLSTFLKAFSIELKIKYIYISGVSF